MNAFTSGAAPVRTPQEDRCDLILRVLNSLSEQIAVLDLQGGIVAVNQSWLDFAEENGVDLSGQPTTQNYLNVCDDADGVCSEEAGAAAKGIRRVLAGESREFRLEYPCHSPTEQRWFLLYATPLVRDGRISGAVVSHLLITDRILAENRQRESEARLKIAQSLAHVGSFERDLGSGSGTWSEELFRIFGHGPDTFAPSFQDFLDHVHPADRDGVARLFNECRKTGLGFQAEFRILPQNGGERYVALTCSYDRDPLGQPLRYHGAILDITERHAAAEQLKLLANVDALTGMANRRHFLEMLHAEWERTLRFGQPLCLVMLDLDDFKHVNDAYGHAVGDQMLRHITMLVSSALRSVDTLGRLGGEEFCLLLPQTMLEAGRVVVERILALVRATPLDAPRRSIRQTLSCGLAVLDFKAQSTMSVDELLKCADDALYRAKANGKDRVEIHASEA